MGPAGKAAPEPQEIKRRPARLGLGASAVPLPPTHKKFIKPGEKRVENSNGSTGGGSGRADVSQLQPVSVRASELRTGSGALSSRPASRSESVAQASGSGRETVPLSTWVVRGIRVKVVDDASDSYLKKGVVVSTTREPRRCSVRLDGSGRIVEGLRQSQLETVVPSASDQRVLVVGPRSRYRGLRGSVVHRDARNGTVQLRLEEGLSDNEEVKVSMDDVAELVSTD